MGSDNGRLHPFRGGGLELVDRTDPHLCESNRVAGPCAEKSGKCGAAAPVILTRNGIDEITAYDVHDRSV